MIYCRFVDFKGVCSAANTHKKKVLYCLPAITLWFIVILNCGTSILPVIEITKIISKSTRTTTMSPIDQPKRKFHTDKFGRN